MTENGGLMICKKCKRIDFIFPDTVSQHQTLKDFIRVPTCFPCNVSLIKFVPDQWKITQRRN